MGMDVYGLNPTTEAPPQPDENMPEEWREKAWQDYFDGQAKSGQYFRNNVWYWRPLWDYVYELCSEVITEEDYDLGHHNSGHEIDAETCKYIANALKIELNNGGVESYKVLYDRALEALPLVECNICNGTGQRDDEYVQGDCNGCEGKGERKDSRTSYPFTVDNVKEFQHFVENCGGFSIC
jgi:hypothetical protein